MAESPEEIADLWAEYAPKIKEAQRRAATAKEEIFLPWYEDNINGVAAVQLTPQRYLLLTVSNALVAEDCPTFESVLRFLWIVSPSFCESKWRGKLFRWRLRNLDPQKTVEACGDYLKRAFRFQPPTKLEGSGGGSQDWVSSLVDVVASEYGWPLEEIMNTPISVLFLFCSRIRSRLSGKPVNFSSEADKLKAEYLQRVNKGAA